ncbi:HlyD family efflux transporter periplasmic adaptor subunit [Nibrella saemangeumensis]|uniref:HlyD family efflux transporter periplasmic adaptor subunit n=1 Tax=Nibrella saemangeumensis TaxID=1084526 RepID=A0ABP8NFY3_9BACT
MNTLLQELDEIQYTDLYHVDDAPIADLRLKALSRAGWWAVALVLVGIVAGFAIVLPDTITTPFVLKSEGAEAIYRFPSNVYIEKMHVKNGQAVKAGDVLLEISAPDIAAISNELVTARHSLTNFERFRTASAANERKMTEVNIRQIQEDIALKQTQLEIVERKWASESARLSYDEQEAKRIWQTNTELFKNGDISRNDLKQLEGTYMRARTAQEQAQQNYLDQRNALNQQIVAQRLAITSLETKIAKSNTELMQEKERLNSQLVTGQKRIQGMYGAFSVTENNHLLLKAERNGTISFLFDGEKEVPAGTILLRMTNEETPLYAYTQVTSSQIGKLTEGQPVVLKLDAYPVYEWGPAHGQVSHVSLTPDEKGLFNVQVQLTDSGTMKDRLRIGMRGNGEVIADELTFFGHLFRKFRKTASALVD